MSAFGPVTRRSRSPTVSRPRRKLPRGLVGKAEQVPAGSQPVLGDRPENLLFQLGAHARQLAKLPVHAQLFQFVDRMNLEVLEQQSDALGAQPLYLQEFKRASWEVGQQFVPPFAGTTFIYLFDDKSKALPDSRDLRDFARFVAKQCRNALGLALYRRGAVP